MLEKLHPPVREAWAKWLSVTRERCHIYYQLEGGDLDEHIDACFASAREVCERIVRDVKAIAPHRILEVGCSVGFNCFALAQRYPTATVVGIEPDREAVAVANATADESMSNNVAFVVAVGEGLPFRDAEFDLIVCHTVIEHVGSVSSVVGEMARVLSRTGVIHLEAPNYVWPREPHLEIWCVPLFGKRLMRLFAALQGKRQFSSFLDHLQLVTPRRLQRLFDRHGLEWQSQVRTKLRSAADGAHGVVKAYRNLATVLRILNRLHLSTFLVNTACAIGVYPSVTYTVRRRQAISPPADTARTA
jgi:2-polyprenyl-3-methyl-5-hydroxy-6-metoxy-1,4-benzoquinol methylase